MQSNGSGDLQVKIQTPEGVVWEGNADSVSSHNSAGPFDILPEHASFITLIDGQNIQVLTQSGVRDFTFARALLSVANDVVSIYGDISGGDIPDKPNK